MLLYDSPGLGQLLQGPAAARASRHRLRAARARRRRPLEPPGAARRAEPGAARADAGARRRPLARRVERDPLVLRRGHAVPARGSIRAGAGAAVDVLRAVRPRAVHRGRALLGRSSPAARRRAPTQIDARRAAGYARSTRWSAQLRAAASSSSASATRSPTSPSTPTRTSPHEGGFDLAAYPATRAWLGRVAGQPGHVPITA